MFSSNTTQVSGSAPDPQFNYVTMLLHGDGTNGAQNNTFLDSSTNNFTITRNGNTTQGSFSPYGSNWSFFNPDSIGGISVPTSTALDLGTGDFTIEAWVNTSKLPTTNAFQTSPGGYQNIFGTGPDSNPIGTSMYIGVTNLKFEISTDGGGPIDVAHNMVAGVWYHIAVSRSGTTFRAFINGALVQTATSALSANNGYGWGIMRSERIGGSAFDGAWWFGYVSNFRVVKGTAVYTSAFTPSTAPLTAISGTSLLTCQSNRFIDTSSTAATVTVAGSTSVQRFNPFGTATAYSTSVIGGSGYFDGSGDYLSVANNTALQFGTGDFTVEGWFYMTGAPFANNSLFSIGSFNGGILLRYRAAGSDNFYFNNTGYDWNPSTNFRLNQWNHVAVVRSGTTVSVYVNGTSVFSVTNSSSLAQSTATSIGTATHDVSNESCLGYISNFRMVKGTAVYTANFTPPTTPVTAITNTSLLTNFTNSAIFDNAMMNDLETVGNAQISTSVVKYGTGSIAFDGSSSYLAQPFTPQINFGSGAFTIECWVYPTANQTDNWIYAVAAGGTGYYVFRVVTTNKIQFIWNNFASSVTSTGTLSLNVWTHIAVSCTGSTVTLYINGVADGSTSISGITAAPSGTQGCVGNQIGLARYFNGYIDDLRITKGFARYTTTFTPPTAAFSDTGPV